MCEERRRTSVAFIIESREENACRELEKLTAKKKSNVLFY